jgi:GTP-binding protein
MAQFPHARYLTGAHEPGQFWSDSGVEVAFAGRSNSGKSTAINAITQRKNLARASKAPGQTRLVNFFELAPGLRLVDLPGYGYAQVARTVQEHWQRLIESYFADRSSIAGLMLIVDARRGLDARDLELMDYAGSDRAIHVLLSKADKLAHGARIQRLAQTRSELAGRAGAQLFSATDQTEISEARSALKAMLERR